MGQRLRCWGEDVTGRKLRAIDVYSGVGGWSLGLSLADVEVVASYEWWEQANLTNRLNNAHSTHTVDVRALSLESLPADIDIVVGSPPCTEFSYSNRGGGGDIKDGLRDVIKFLSIVEHLRPTWWVMENVPRVAQIIEKHLGKRGRLARFRHLGMSTAVLNMEDFGLPQRRKRCFVGNIDFELLRSYTSKLPPRTLGDVITALTQDVVTDPLFGVVLPKGKLQEHETEPFLDAEELRINEAGKAAHPVYNAMPFPDPLDRTVRTITATCTRVSRESVIIEAPECKGSYRRLTVRERACLQGFPITYQFYGASYGQKLRMVGNAVPPAISFYVAHAIRNTPPDKIPSLSSVGSGLSSPATPPPKTVPERAGRKFLANRTFRFAIPNLRLKSGVRFEMVNVFDDAQPAWEVRFYFGTSKDIRSIVLDAGLFTQLSGGLSGKVKVAVERELGDLTAFLADSDLRRMQAVWSHRGPGGTRPFSVLDQLGTVATSLTEVLADEPACLSEAAVKDALRYQYEAKVGTLPGVPKLLRNAGLIHAGMLVGSTANLAFAQQFVPHTSERKRASR